MKPISVVRTSSRIARERSFGHFDPTSREGAVKICAQVMARSERELHCLLDEIHFGRHGANMRTPLRIQRPGPALFTSQNQNRNAHFSGCLVPILCNTFHSNA